ncbi:hypothetical protein WJX84_011081 [Apatococcus fuscideae]|uniref:Vacuolar protein sorting-associated protein 54 N-terminal domain-containing protein n=1 Tax=Apatococcus fuscideae TaxID=2026836 RepID=A0AAW1T6Q0_9CHLO
MLRSIRSRTAGRVRSSSTGEGLDSPRLVRLQQAAHALQESDVAPEVQQARADRREARLAALEPEFYNPDFDPVLYELQRLPPRFDESELEPVVENRAGVLEIVSEKLSQHVLKNYGAFVSGVNEVASIEHDLTEAYRLAKVSRGELAIALAEVDVNMKIAAQTKQKQGLMAILTCSSACSRCPVCMTPSSGPISPVGHLMANTAAQQRELS